MVYKSLDDGVFLLQWKHYIGETFGLRGPGCSFTVSDGIRWSTCKCMILSGDVKGRNCIKQTCVFSLPVMHDIKGSKPN